MDKETVNKLIINSLIKKGYKLEEVDQDFLNDMAEIMYKQLALCNVSCSLPEQKDFISSIKEDIEVMNFHYTDREKLLIRLGADYAYSKMHKHINE